MTSIPGEGHSAPIVSGDAVYLTTAHEVQPTTTSGLLALYTQFGGMLPLAVLATHFTVRRCVNLSGRDGPLRSLAGLTGLALTVAMVCLLGLFGEGIIDFDRALERTWMASSLFGTTCLLLCALYVPSRRRAQLLVGTLLPGFAMILAVAHPNRADALKDGLLNVRALFMYVVIALPGSSGMVMLSLFITESMERRRATGSCDSVRPGGIRDPTLKWLTLAAAASAIPLAVVMATTVVREQRKTLTTLSVGQPLQPLVKWWLLCAVVGLHAVLAVWHHKARGSFLRNLSLVVAATSFCLVAFAGIVEQAAVNSPYLSYLLALPPWSHGSVGLSHWSY